MTRLALIGDVHSNLRALEAVLSDAKKNEIPLENIFFTGDMIGYGFQPLGCLSIVGYLTGDFPDIEDPQLEMIPKSYRTSSAKARALKGNHEVAILMKMMNPRINLGGYGISEKAEEAIDRTIAAFNEDSSRPEKGFKTHFQYLKGLPKEIILDTDGVNMYLVHTNPLDPDDHSGYVLDEKTAAEVGKKNFISPREIFASERMAQFQFISVSHTHIPGISVGNSSGQSRTFEDILDESMIRKSDTKILVSTGSAGCSRVDEKVANYAIADTNGPVLVEIRKVNI